MAGILDPRTPTDLAARAQRERIVDAMVASCAEKSFSGTTISDIVAGASISRTTFYKHFDDKRACFDAAVDACIEEVKRVAGGAHTAADPPVDAVAKATVAVLELMAARPALAQLLTGDAPGVEPAVVTSYRALMIPAVQQLWEVAGKQQEEFIDPKLAFGRAQVLIFNQIAAGEAESLPDLLPEIVYLAIAPFAGHEEAVSQVRIAIAKFAAEEAPGL